MFKHVYVVIVWYFMLYNKIQDFASLKSHRHIASVCISMGNMYIIDLSGDLIMDVAVLNVIGLKYFWNIAMVKLIHNYSNDVVNQINEFQFFSYGFRTG